MDIDGLLWPSGVPYVLLNSCAMRRGRSPTRWRFGVRDNTLDEIKENCCPHACDVLRTEMDQVFTTDGEGAKMSAQGGVGGTDRQTM